MDPFAPSRPDGGVVPHVNLEGASDASAFYQKAFAAEEVSRLPAQDGKRLMHCHLKINGGSLMLSDIFQDMGGPDSQEANFAPSAGMTMHLEVDDADAWFRRAIEAGATSTMEPQDMFWGDRYGRLRDPFGLSWSIGSPLKSA